MKHPLLLIVMITLAHLAVNGMTRADSLRQELYRAVGGDVMVVAHRADWRYAPENSLAAIEHCIAIGVDIVELDLQMTKDSALVVMHDATLNRTTNGKGYVKDWTLDSIKGLVLKNGCGIKTVHKVPTLEEAMLTAKGRVLVNLDKADSYFRYLMPILRKTGTAGQVIMKSNRGADDVMADFGEGISEVIYMPKINYEEADAMEKLYDVRSKLRSPIYEMKYAGDATLEKAIAGSNVVSGESRIWYNTLWDTQCGGHDDEVALSDCNAAYGFLIDSLKANVIQTDRVVLLLDYLRSRNLHK